MKRLIRLASRLYPRTWKKRYAEEFYSLLDDLDPRWWDALDVLKGAAAMQMNRWIVVGMAFVGTGVLAGAMFFYFAHHHSEHASAQKAELEFQRLRARFAGQSPLIDMRERRPLADASEQQAGARLHAFHAMIFDTRRQRAPRSHQRALPFRTFVRTRWWVSVARRVDLPR